MDLPLRGDSVRFKLLAALAALGGIAGIGVVDFYTGVEYRVFPLYFLPLSVAAWYLGHTAALAGAVLAACSWLLSNSFAGLRFAPAVWVINVLMQGVSFAVVGSLLATLRHRIELARRLSRTDSLTSLLNTRAFYEDGRRVLANARRYGRPVTLAYVDLDNFKGVNDRLGHEGGDDVLRRITALLTQCIRETDLAARLGGDEFALLPV